MEKIVKVSFDYLGQHVCADYYADSGYDQINGLLECIADAFEQTDGVDCEDEIFAELISGLITGTSEAIARAASEGRTRETIGKFDLSANGVSNVRFQLETGKWVDVKEEWLLKV
ncbi:hypothetical protein [Citrobacter portucalensis]|uniref:hypothetical protein n=1 Tax=Citrobacter portucalensis TaxID=1639133 RepID=UPI00254A10CD|nr:hypothetical protein [Citrobacter portucalensis]